MKLYVPGRESDKRVRILIKLTKITSNDIIAALRAHLVKGWTEELAAYTYDVDISNLKRALRRINDVIGLHNQLSDLNLTEQGKLTPTQLRLKEAVDNCNHSAYFIAKKSKVDPEATKNERYPSLSSHPKTKRILHLLRATTSRHSRT